MCGMPCERPIIMHIGASMHIAVEHTQRRDMDVMSGVAYASQCHYPVHPSNRWRTHMKYVHYMRRQKTCMCERDVCFHIARHRSFGTGVISVSLWTPNTTLHSALCYVYHEMNKNHLKSSHGRHRWICVRYIYIYLYMPNG